MSEYYSEGDASQAVCVHCETLVNTTFKMRNVPLDQKPDTTVFLLAGVCDDCDEVVAIPAQSTSAIREALAGLGMD